MLSVSLLEIAPEDHVFFYWDILSPLKELRAWFFILANLIKSTSMICAKFSYYVDPVVLDKKLWEKRFRKIDNGQQNIRKAHLRDIKKN